jgi:PAS domain S-box-containing protein
MIVVGLISLFGLLEVIGFIVGAELNLEDVMTRYLAKVSSIPFETMSPVAGGALMFLVGAALLALLGRQTASESRRMLGDLAGALGLAAATINLVFCLGYALGAPLLYGGPAIPVSLTGALGGLIMAVGTVAAAGREHWPLRVVAGDSTRARLLRAFVPLTVFAALAVSVAHHRLGALENVDHVVVASALAVAFALLAGLLASRMAHVIGGMIDRARQAQERSEQALREAKDHLEIRVRERTAQLERANRALDNENAERQRAEQAVKAERQRFNDILEMLPAYLVLLTPDYRVPFANRFFRERFGESHGRRCFEYLFARSEPCEACETYSVLRTMAPHHWEWTGPDGRNYDIFDFPFTDTDGSTLIMEVGIDITERKWAEQELRRLNAELEQRVAQRTAELTAAQRLLQTIVENTEAHLVYLDPDFNFIWVNSAYAQACRRAKEDFVGHNHFEFYPDAENEAIFSRVRDTGEPAKYIEKPFEFPDMPERGVTYWDWTLTPVKDAGGKVEGLVFSLADVTDQVKQRQQLLAAERARSELLVTLNREISHRVKNNLSMVAGTLQMQIAAERDSRLAAMLQDAISRLYAFAAVHDQLTVTQAGEVDLAAAVRLCAQTAHRVFAAADVAISVEGGALRYPSSIATSLSVIANELIINAVKHGAPGPEGQLHVKVRVAREQGRLRLSVWNSGNPVSADLDLSRQTGLGLSLVQSLVVGQYAGTFALKPEGGGTLAEVMVAEEQFVGA